MPETWAPGGALARAASRSPPVERGRGPPKTSAKDAKRRSPFTEGRSIPSPLLARRRGARVRGTRVCRGWRCAIRRRRSSSCVAGWRGSRVARGRSRLLGRWERVLGRRAGRLLLRASRDQQERSHAQEQSTAIHRVTSLFGLRFPALGEITGRWVVTHMPVKRSDVAFGVRLYRRNLKPAPAEVSATLHAALAWLEAMS
jgi:hypothetical protein